MNINIDMLLNKHVRTNMLICHDKDLHIFDYAYIYELVHRQNKITVFSN